MKVLAILFVFIGLASCQQKAPTTPDKPADVESEDSAEKVSYVDMKPAQFKTSFEADANAVILDVRTPEETAEGMIEGAIELDYYGDDFKSELMKLDQSKSYYVYCRSGGRSSDVTEMMVENGFTNVYNLLGGYTAWKESDQEK